MIEDGASRMALDPDTPIYNALIYKQAPRTVVAATSARIAELANQQTWPDAPLVRVSRRVSNR